MNKELTVIAKTRGHRIREERRDQKQVQKRKMASYILAGTLATSAFITVNVTNKEAAFQLVHKVQSGETLFGLSHRYGVSVTEIMQANKLSSDLIKVGQTLTIPQKNSQSSHQRNTQNVIHKVEKGDTLFSISQKYGVAVSAIQQANGLVSDRIVEGQNLQISTSVQVQSYKVSLGETLFSISRKFGTSVERIKNENKLDKDTIFAGQPLRIPSGTTKVMPTSTSVTQTTSKLIPLEQATYTVAPGDTLWSIARRYQTTAGELKHVNGMTQEHVIIGQKLIIKGKGLVQANAEVVGVVDQSSVEFLVEGLKEPIVLRVAYGTAQNYELISGAKLKIIYKQSEQPALIDCIFASQSF
ncbi:LysM peptidoglycan-binding domain-containing protein [Bacillus alkalisoli]|uniref:LysM peptidoglycan-binding domain-containing protein n=1 Tax=Bacillus alkalisoli TaxID=2011008 RepID=UPI000C2347CD|nr:LysM peptidoglycan-binding domain-containing protein [Bacillus alkalisoli]